MMKQAIQFNPRSSDLELMQGFSASASLCPGIVAGLSRKGRFNLILALHAFTGHLAGLSGEPDAEAPRQLN